MRIAIPNEDGVFRTATRAACDGDLPELDRILSTEPGVLEARDAEGFTVLGLACKAATGDIAIPPAPGTPEQHAAIDRLLAAGADPSAATEDGWGPLHVAAMAGHLDLVRRLLAAGASLEGRLHGCVGGSPLSLALFYAKTEIGHVLAHPPTPDNLRNAAALGRPLDCFVDGEELSPRAGDGVDFYRPSLQFPEWQRTKSRQELLDEALSWAACNDQCRAMETLVRLGANVDANPYRGTPLLWAVYGDRIAAAQWLLDHGADPDLRHDFGGDGHGVAAVAMHLAAQFSSLRCLRLLLERGADPNIVDGAHGGTPLEWAQHSDAEDSAALLESWGRR